MKKRLTPEERKILKEEIEQREFIFQKMVENDVESFRDSLKDKNLAELKAMLDANL